MPEQLWFTEILNRLFAGPVVSLLRALHIEPKYPQAPITDAFAMEFLVFVVLLVLFLLVRSRLSVDDPGGLQLVFESVEGFIQGQSNEIIGHHSEGYTPFLAALLFFILFSNLIGVIPGFESPTAVPVVPLGCALCAFAYYQTQGFKHAGIGYLKHFLGPSDPTMSIFIRLPLALLMLPIELISHLARMLSLTIRLFANMFAGDMVTLVFFSLVPLGVPILFLGLHIGVSLLQTYIFVLLTTVYLSGAVAEEH
ncbi:ATP synthase subunit a [Candidatus Sulfotelmatobacter kueseliae]|uniref:ATP synthase subunit a n=1 Tax=Candidatus Sulfotelmatobacter kueseliae TaxID=2042962 RepID=A0A2U3KXF8_9BACT|nr:ATP synthase subunit a [Candidatus Sulfotelmatobacter kueseliae]